MKYFVTGATGFIGNNIVRELLKERESEVIALARNKNDVSLQGLDITIIQGDVCDVALMDKILEEEMIVVHVAGIVALDNKDYDRVMKVNYEATKDLVDLAIKNKVKKFVYVSSVEAIYKKKHSISKEPVEFYPEKIKLAYGKSKALSSRYVYDKIKNEELNGIILYPSAVFGPRDYKDTNNITAIFKKAIDGKLLGIVKGSYNFIYIDDLSKLVVKACKENCGTYLATGEEVSIERLMTAIFKVLGKKKPRKYPLWLAKFGCFFVSLYSKITGKQELYTLANIRYLNLGYQYDNHKMMNDFKMELTNFEDAIKETVDWYLACKKDENKV
ncbi:MAG TPA: NAD-dependent epimerase/dehydratase family protein [Acholeplasma sp.]|nr:NAD-dependent epimerase/dehydratase family protein [Acholeplasma sp.]